MLEVEFIQHAPQQMPLQALAFYGDKLPDFLPPLAKEAIKRKPHDKVFEVFLPQDPQPVRLIIARLGNQSSATRKEREEAGAALIKKCAEGTDTVVYLDLKEMEAEGLDLATGMLLSSWRFHKHRTIFQPEEISTLKKIVILSKHPSQLQKHFQRMKACVEGVLFARSLTSEPSNILYPAAYAHSLNELKELGIEVDVLDEDELNAIGMTALLAVGQGSIHATSVAILQWRGGSSAEPPIAFVGKGVCFDSGGLFLKPQEQQLVMKWDKAGAGIVAGLIKTLALSKAPFDVVGIIGLVENMPDGGAVKPGDVIRTMSGQTVEIADTDAEGRLLLADCLWYAQQKFKPRILIDLGTLTIETMASLGSVYAGLYSNDSQLARELKKAGERSGDLLWELPMGPFFAKQIESLVADMKNVGVGLNGENGAAAEFLKRFVKDTLWAHIDIAGTSWTTEDMPLAPKGVTGFGVRLLEEWLYNKDVKD